MILYYFPILGVFFSFLALFHPLFKHIVVFLILTFVIVFCGLRYDSDTDFILYLELFRSTPPIDMLSFKAIKTLYGEPGYILLTSFIRYLELDFVVVTLLFSLTSILLKLYVSYKLSRYYFYVVSIYLCLSFITVEFIELRWSISSSILILSIYFLSIDKKNKAVFLIVFSSMFQYFSILYFCIFFVKKKKIAFINFLFLFSFLMALFYKTFGVSVGFVFDTDIYIVRRFLRYLNNPESSLGLFSYLKVIFYFFSFKFIEHYFVNENDQNQFLKKMSVFLLSISLLLSFIPLLFYRAMVIADFISILYLFNLLYKVRTCYFKVLYIFMISILFSTWSYLDVKNYYASSYIYEYSSWLRFLW